MGLDMYAYATKKCPKAAVDFDTGIDDIQLHCWRKHPNLHGWFRALYYFIKQKELPGKNHNTVMGESFNCKPVLLSAKNIERLEEDIKKDTLPRTTGFFFGSTDGSEKEDDLLFIKEAKQAIKDGYHVYYTAWW